MSCQTWHVPLLIANYSLLDNVVSSKVTNITKGEKHTGTLNQLIQLIQLVASRRAYAIMSCNSEDEAKAEVWGNIYRDLKEYLKVSCPFKKDPSQLVQYPFEVTQQRTFCGNVVPACWEGAVLDDFFTYVTAMRREIKNISIHRQQLLYEVVTQPFWGKTFK